MCLLLGTGVSNPQFFQIGVGHLKKGEREKGWSAKRVLCNRYDRICIGWMNLSSNFDEMFNFSSDFRLFSLSFQGRDGSRPSWNCFEISWRMCKAGKMALFEELTFGHCLAANIRKGTTDRQVFLIKKIDEFDNLWLLSWSLWNQGGIRN